jgi:hypothetical protein
VAPYLTLTLSAKRTRSGRSVTLRNVPDDWTSVVKQAVPAGQLNSTAHGALAVYVTHVISLSERFVNAYVESHSEEYHITLS